MAKVSYFDGKQVSGKTNKKSKEVHRVINGKEYTHTIENPYEGPISDAQKLQRKVFGKTNAIVNGIVNDPKQYIEWQARMEEYNRSVVRPDLPPFLKRYKTVRSFVYHIISEQVNQKQATKRHRAKLPLALPKGVKAYIKLFSELTNAELYELLKARFNVFVCEQHIHYLDEDNIDYTATHFMLRRKNIVIAYARAFKDTEKGVICIGRMLTLERNKGFGKYLVERIAAEAREKGAHTLRLHAQTQAVPFYEHLGFKTVSGVFTEAEIPHVMMERKL